MQWAKRKKGEESLSLSLVEERRLGGWKMDQSGVENSVENLLACVLSKC